MREVLQEIESGAFAREFLDRNADPQVGLAALLELEADGRLVAAGRRVLPRLHPDRTEHGHD